MSTFPPAPPPSAPAEPSAPVAAGASGETPPPPGPGILLLRVVGTVVTVLAVAAASVGVVGRFFRQERTETAVYTQPLTEVSVQATTGDVRVDAGTPGSPVVVRRTLDWSFGTAASAETVVDGRLEVAARCSGQFGFGDCSVSYEITAPPELAVRLSTHTGDVEVAGRQADVTVSSHTGDVRVLGVRSPRVEVDTSTGDIELAFAAAPTEVRASATTGDVVLRLPVGASYDVRTTTSTGDATVAVPTDPSSPRHVVARTSTGNIDVAQAS